MLVEKKLSEAIKDHDAGKKVVVLQEMEDGSMFSAPFEEFCVAGIHYLVDVPAYANLEFEKRICEISNNQEDPSDKSTDLSGVVQNTVPEEAQKSKLEVVEELMEQNKSVKEIEQITGFDKALIYQYRCKINKKKSEQPVKPSGNNADRHLCKTCMFRGKRNNDKGIGCEYALHNNHTRGCSIEDCNVYKQGDPERIVKAPVLI